MNNGGSFLAYWAKEWQYEYMNITVPDVLPEEVEILFKEVYESAEWKKLDPIDRAQLLLVVEGVKPGTIIGGDFTHFPKIAEKLGLEYSFNTDPLELKPVYMVARKAVLDNYFRGTITPPNDKNLGECWQHLNGKFLGYPRCCTDEYCHPQHPYESNFSFEVKKEIEATGTYPEELDFRPPSFTPCGAHCGCASPLLKTWMHTLRAGDPEAAEKLQLWNQKNGPGKEIHKEKLKRKYSEWRDKVGRIIIPE